MGLFGNKKKGSRVVWRNSKGEIFCPGDSCPQNCDDTCPVYLHTQAAALVLAGQGEKAIPIYEKALSIAPDFYDAWNNIAGIYGEIGNFQKAYECYLLARSYNKTKPNPLYGLVMTTRDLGKYEECLKWCDEYNKIAKNVKIDEIRDLAEKKLQRIMSPEELNNVEMQVSAIAKREALREYKELPDVSLYFDSEHLSKEIIEYCKMQNEDGFVQKLFIISYYSAICLALHHIYNSQSFDKTKAFHYLKSRYDIEHLKKSSEELLGCSECDGISENIHNSVTEFIKQFSEITVGKDIPDSLFSVIAKGCYQIGIAAAKHYYQPRQLKSVLSKVSADDIILPQKNIANTIEAFDMTVLGKDKNHPIIVDFIRELKDEYIGKYVQIIGLYSKCDEEASELRCDLVHYSVRGEYRVSLELLNPMPKYITEVMEENQEPIVFRGILERRKDGYFSQYNLANAEYQDYWRSEDGRISCNNRLCGHACDNQCPVYLNSQAKKNQEMFCRDEAIKMSKRAVLLAPYYVAAWANLGFLYLEDQQFMEAYNAFNSALDYEKYNERILFGLIVSLSKTEKIKEAREVFENYKKTFPYHDYSLLSEIIADCELKEKNNTLAFDIRL